MDVIGPIPKTKMGKRYILVVIDYATLYAEVYAMRTITTPAVAEKLIKVFSHYGGPKEILSNQSTNFMSELLQETYQLRELSQYRQTTNR